MINYEKYKKEIDLMLQRKKDIAFNKNTKKIFTCEDLDCEDCLFSHRYNERYCCSTNIIEWLVSEYKEPVEAEIDWNKIPVDTPVLISVDNKNWFNRYFAGVNEKGQPTVFCYGATQWSNGYEEPCHFKYIKLAEVDNEKSK